MKIFSTVGRSWIYADRFDVNVDSFDAVVKKVSVFCSNDDEVVLVRWWCIAR